MIVLRQRHFNVPAVITPATPAVPTPVSTPTAKPAGMGSWIKANPGKAALGALAIGGTMLAAKKVKDNMNNKKEA